MAFFDEQMAQYRQPEAAPATDPTLEILMRLLGGGAETTYERPKLSTLTKFMLSAQAPNTPLSPKRSDARGQLFLRGLVGGANRRGGLDATEQGYDVAGRTGAIRGGGGGSGGISPYQQYLIANGLRDDAESRRRWEADHALREKQFEALVGSRAVDDKRQADMAKFMEWATRQRIGQGDQRIQISLGNQGLAREKFAFAKQKAQALLAAINDPLLKTEVAAKLAALGKMYDEDEEGSDLRYWIDVQNVIQDARQRSGSFPDVRRGGGSTAAPPGASGGKVLSPQAIQAAVAKAGNRASAIKQIEQARASLDPGSYNAARAEIDRQYPR